jgi:hypothetical protein
MPRKETRYPFDMELGRNQSWSGCCGEQKNPDLPGKETGMSRLQPSRYIHCLAWDLLTFTISRCVSVNHSSVFPSNPFVFLSDHWVLLSQTTHVSFFVLCDLFWSSAFSVNSVLFYILQTILSFISLAYVKLRFQPVSRKYLNQLFILSDLNWVITFYY